jgi:hypothetical protein
MLDFRRLGTPSLWKSGPLFSTGIKEVGLLVRKPRLNLQSPVARFAGSRVSDMVGILERGVGPRLSTAFAKMLGRRSTGAHSLVHTPNRASGQGE